MRAIPSPAADAFTRKHDTLCLLGDICCTLLYRPELAAHAIAIQHDGPLATGLVRLLAAAFQAVAVALQLPAEGRSAKHAAWTWSHLENLAYALDATALRGALEAHLASDGHGLSSAALQLLQPTCQLLGRAPYDSRPDEPDQPSAAICSCCELGGTIGLLLSERVQRQRQHGNWRWNEQAQRTYQLLQQLLPRLVPLLLWREQLQPTEDTPLEPALLYMLSGMVGVVRLLLMMTLLLSPAAGQLPPTSFQSLSAAEGWCAGAADALRSLAVLGQLAQRHEGCIGPATADLARAIVTGVACFASHMNDSTVKVGSMQDPDLKPLCSALFKLHTTACRAAHFSLAAWQIDGLQQPLLLTLSSLLREVTRWVWTAADAEQPRLHMSMLKPLAASHLAAVQALLGTPAQARQLATEQPVLAARVADSVALALSVCPEPLLFTPGLPDLFSALTDPLVRVRTAVPSSGKCNAKAARCSTSWGFYELN